MSTEVDLLLALATRPESDTLDFKQELYNFSNADARAEFVKDILAMANTPRSGAAYIVIGAKFSASTGAQLVGMKAPMLDDQTVISALRDVVHPVPNIRYTPVQHDGKHFAVVEIPVERGAGRPFLPTQALGTRVRKDALYTRQGSNNSEAGFDATLKIDQWFKGGASTPVAIQNVEAWTRFLAATDHFRPAATYLLIAEPQRSNGGDLPGFGFAPWAAAIDMDPASETGGLFGTSQGALQARRGVHVLVPGDRAVFTLARATSWFFARGLQGREATLHTGAFKDWLGSCGRAVSEFVDGLAKSASPSPVTAVFLFGDCSLRRHFEYVRDALTSALGTSLTNVVIVPPGLSLDESWSDDSTIIDIDARGVSSGLHDLFSSIDSSRDARCALPTRGGAPVKIESRDRAYFEEDLELLHLDVGLEGDDSPRDFALGAVPSWRNFQLRHDCDRDVTDQLRGRVAIELARNRTDRISLYHAPGCGGTTVARRVAWDLHTSFPCAVLRRCDVPATVERLSQLVSRTSQSVLLIVEDRDHLQTSLDQLFLQLQSQQIPVVVLQVLRRFDPRALRDREYAVPAELTRRELDAFRALYTHLVPERAAEIRTLVERGAAREHSPFYFGLTAFGRAFKGLEPFVAARLPPTGTPAREVVAFLALSHSYARQSLPAAAFAAVLGTPRDRVVDLSRAIDGAAAELLVTDGTSWRLSHHLIAQEALEQILGGADRGHWKQVLSTWAMSFAEFLRSDTPVPSERLAEVARRTYILRDNVELLGTERASQTQFSQLIEDIPSKEGRLEVLRRVSKLFPDEAHFHAHIGRFCASIDRFDEAMEEIDRAIAISDDDYVLHHMRGMIIRRRIASIVELRADETALGESIAYARQASHSFARSRELNRANEHGYVSEVQMITRLLDFAAKVEKRNVIDIVSSRTSDAYLRDGLDRAEELVEKLEIERAGEEAPSRYAEDCRAHLSSLYGDFSKALQIWDNMLTRSDANRGQIRRQLVRTLLRRSGGEWSALPQRDADRCLQYLNENLEEAHADASSMRLWLRAIRFSTVRTSLDTAIERVSYWKANTGDIDALYYAYVLQLLNALDGSALARGDAERALDECRQAASRRWNRNISFEWVGARGEGIRRLLHYRQLGEWDPTTDFWQNRSLLARVSGRIASISKPQQGQIEAAGGLQVFFVPGRHGFVQGRDENRRVTFFLGFSYDGPRAWEVDAEP